MKAKAYNLVNHVEQEELDAGLLAEYYNVEASDGKGTVSYTHLRAHET